MNKPDFTCCNLRRFQGVFIFFIASVSYIVNVDAQLSWGVNGAGGDGTWDSVTPNWSDGTTNVPWIDGGSAAFGGVAGTVSISGSVTASTVAFGVPGYVLQNGSLTSAPGGLTVRTDADATINSAISRPNGSIITFTKTGTATLRTFNALSTFSRVAVEEGELHLTGSFSNPVVSLGSSGGATLTLGDMGTFTFSIGGLFGGGIVQPGAGTGAQVLSVYGAGGIFGGSIRDNTGATLGLYKSGTGVQRLTGTNTYTGRTDIVSGTLALAEGGMALNTAVTVNGGTLLLDNSAVSIADRLSDSAPVTMFGGSIVFQGHGLAPATETVGSLVLGNNPVSIAANPIAAQPAALTFASLSTRTASRKGMVTFTGAKLGQPEGPGVASIFFKTPPLVGGSDLHPEARIVPGAFGIGASGTTLATYGANGIRPLADEDYANDLSRISHWENADVSTAQTIRPDTSVNSLRLRGNASITGNETLSLRSGIILTQPGEARIAVRTLDFGTSEMLIANEGNLTITGRVTGTNGALGLTKFGAGRLVFAGSAEFAGRIDVFQGVLRLQNATSLGGAAKPVNVASGAAIELAGGVVLTNGGWTIDGNGPDNRGALRNVSGDNRIGPVQLLNSSIIDAVSGNLTVAGGLSTFNLRKTGAGSLTVTGSVSNTQGIVVTGGGTLASTRNTGSPFVGSGIILDGSALRFAPATLSALESVALSVPGTFIYKGGASTLALDRGANAGVTVTFASAFTRTSPATLLIAPAGGFATLGTMEKIKLNSTLDTAFPMVNGIVAASIIAQDTDANRSGDFLSYTAATGLKRATFSTNTNLATAGSTAVFNATTPQALTAAATVYALKNSGQTINLSGGALIVGGLVDQPSSGIIFNAGSITGGSLFFRGNNAHSIYTSLAGGRIDSWVATTGGSPSNTLLKSGPGKLTLAGYVQANVIVESGTLQLDGTASQSSSSGGASVILARGAVLSGTGGLSGAARGGLISPGNSVGIFTADNTGPSDTTSSGLNESFAPTSFAFEFTRTGAPIFIKPTFSGNDLLRLTTQRVRGFTSALTAADEIDIYLSLDGGVQPGDALRGGFFTDRNASFLDLIDDATFRYFLRDDSGGTVFNGLAYSERTDLPFEIDSVPQTANFGSGDVNGYIMEVRVVPEPSALLLLLAASLAVWSGSMNGRAAHDRRFPRTWEKRPDAGM